jgi:hypothetical protein
MKKLTIILIFIVLIFNNLNCQKSDYVQLSGFTFVKGKIQNFKMYYDEFRTVEITINDWTTAIRKKYYANIDTTGKFAVSFYLFNPQDVLFTYANKWHSVFVSPNDTLEIAIDAEFFPQGNQYFGKTAKACYDYQKYYSETKNILIEIDKRKNLLRSSLSIDAYTALVDSNYAVQLKTIENFIQLNNPDSFLIKWIRNGFYLRSKSDILSYHFLRHGINDLDTSFINSVNIRDSTLRFNSAYAQLINSTSSLIAFSSSRNCGSLNNALSERRSHLEKEEIVLHNKPLLTDEELQKALFNCFIQKAYLLKDDLLRQSVLVHRYLSILEEQNTDVNLEEVLRNIDDYRIKASVMSEYNDYEFRHGNLNSIKMANPGSLVLDKLTDKFKGFVLYIDFWGTWWPPCLPQMEYMKNIKKELKNEKIAFIYLCCKCQKDDWEKTIKDFKGDHIFLTLEEYASLANQLNLVYLPRYIIIDKNGKVVNDNAPNPVQTMSLVNELKKYLKD